jgi:hypothetical protein
MSLKSRAASLFISELLLANLRMTPLPYEGTQRNLQLTHHFKICENDAKPTCRRELQLGAHRPESHEVDG